uniref:VCBS domain-containing protein n=1 Tax=Sulfitobacter sp. TaxID=1903071 RepID=UPI00356743C4
DYLTEGASATETFTATVTDDQNATATQSVTVTITGTNDAPVVAAALTAAADEDDAGFSVDLLDGASDVDAGETATLSVQNVSGLVDGVTLSGTVLSVDPSDSSFQSLALNEQREIEVSYEVVDAQGATVEQTATITITGTNDAPVVAAALTAAAAEDDAGFTVDLLDGASDVDAGETATLSVQNVSGLVEGVTLSGTKLSVDPSDASFQSLALGEEREIAVSYQVVDAQGATVDQTATITITGTNDAPVITSTPITSDLTVGLVAEGSFGPEGFLDNYTGTAGQAEIVTLNGEDVLRVGPQSVIRKPHTLIELAAPGALGSDDVVTIDVSGRGVRTSGYQDYLFGISDGTGALTLFTTDTTGNGGNLFADFIKPSGEVGVGFPFNPGVTSRI